MKINKSSTKWTKSLFFTLMMMYLLKQNWCGRHSQVYFPFFLDAKKSVSCTILVDPFIASKWDGHWLWNIILQSTWETWGLPFETLTRNLEFSRAKHFFNFSIMLLKRIMKSFVMDFKADTFLKRFCKYVWNDSFRQIKFNDESCNFYLFNALRGWNYKMQVWNCTHIWNCATTSYW